jgi:hypothetical protein
VKPTFAGLTARQLGAVSEALDTLRRQFLPEADEGARVYYIGGGSWVVDLPTPEMAQQLAAEFPKSFKKLRTRDRLNQGFYTTEKGAEVAKRWLAQQNVKVGGSSMWDLAPGEHPSW